MKLQGTGKGGGARTIYYQVDLRGEVWFLDIYLKKDKSILTKNDKRKVFKFIKEVINK